MRAFYICVFVCVCVCVCVCTYTGFDLSPGDNSAVFEVPAIIQDIFDKHELMRASVSSVMAQPCLCQQPQNLTQLKL